MKQKRITALVMALALIVSAMSFFSLGTDSAYAKSKKKVKETWTISKVAANGSGNFTYDGKNHSPNYLVYGKSSVTKKERILKSSEYKVEGTKKAKECGNYKWIPKGDGKKTFGGGKTYGWKIVPGTPSSWQCYYSTPYKGEKGHHYVTVSVNVPYCDKATLSVRANFRTKKLWHWDREESVTMKKKSKRLTLENYPIRPGNDYIECKLVMECSGKSYTYTKKYSVEYK